MKSQNLAFFAAFLFLVVSPNLARADSSIYKGKAFTFQFLDAFPSESEVFGYRISRTRLIDSETQTYADDVELSEMPELGACTSVYIDVLKKMESNVRLKDALVGAFPDAKKITVRARASLFLGPKVLNYKLSLTAFRDGAENTDSTTNQSLLISSVSGEYTKLAELCYQIANNPERLINVANELAKQR